ncbi:MAG: YfiR family protein [Candidatus Aminicenantes bacterium]|nr:MAG: YfiR family protein [Candidatus Aminicenantes bacterium]
MKWEKYFILFVMSVLVLHVSLFSIEDEYYRKAALFRVFSQYIRWPENSGMNDRSKPFVIGVIGENPFGSILEKAYSQMEYKIKNKHVEIRFIEKIGDEDLESCNILFLSAAVKNELEDILTITSKKPILTIAETKGFTEKGVLFNLYVCKNKFCFEINALALRESRLIVDSQVLSAARIIDAPGYLK